MPDKAWESPCRVAGNTVWSHMTSDLTSTLEVSHIMRYTNWRILYFTLLYFCDATVHTINLIFRKVLSVLLKNFDKLAFRLTISVRFDFTSSIDCQCLNTLDKLSTALYVCLQTVWFGSDNVTATCEKITIYSVSQKKIPPPRGPNIFSLFSQTVENL